MHIKTQIRSILAIARSILAASCIAALSGGCGGPAPAPSASGPAKVRIGYLGLTCEAAMFAAYENGYYKDEGLDVEFVKTDWDSLRDGLGLGRFDANYHLVMYLLKPIEKGLDVKLTGGIHSGCLRLQAGINTDVKTVADVKGKRIGVPTALGSPPFLFSSRVLKAAGMDPAKDVEWVAMAPDVLGLALDNGQVDAVCNAEPIGSILLSQDKARTIADSAVDEPYKSEYCCAVVVSGDLARNNPATAAKVTRALLKGAAWVDVNPTAAARLSVDKKYVASSVELNARALGQLHFAPGVAKCRESVVLASKEMQAIGLLGALDRSRRAGEERLAGPRRRDRRMAERAEDREGRRRGAAGADRPRPTRRALRHRQGLPGLVRSMPFRVGRLMRRVSRRSSPPSLGKSGVSTLSSETSEPLTSTGAAGADASVGGALAAPALLAPMIAAVCALLLHWGLPSRQSSLPTRTYPTLLAGLLAVSAVLAGVACAWPRLRPWARHNAPLLAGGIVTLTTMVLVTHDIDEAIYMSDRIVVVTPRPGRIECVIHVALERPRLRNSHPFLELRAEILELLHFAGGGTDETVDSSAVQVRRSES